LIAEQLAARPVDEMKPVAGLADHTDGNSAVMKEAASRGGLISAWVSAG
jgi:hypothetical protein